MRTRGLGDPIRAAVAGLCVGAAGFLGACSTVSTPPPVDLSQCPPLPVAAASAVALPVAPKPTRPPHVALALGGGAARGFAHIGVIQVLEENGIHPDIVT